MLDLYLKPFLVAFGISLIFILAIKYFFDKFYSVNKQARLEDRHIHNKKISRWGGVAIAISFLSVILLDGNLVITRDIVGILLGSVIIFFAGLWDDFREMNWKAQLFFQIIAISLVFVFGARIDYFSNPWGGIVYLNTQWGLLIGIGLGTLWSVVLINAMNWIDGIDGLSGGIYFIGAMTLFYLALKPEVNQPPIAIMALGLAGVILGFLFFNFPPAKIMAGSSGIFFVGFLLSSLSIFAGTKIATTLLVLFIPMVDFFWVIAKRLRQKKSIFSPDREHLQHKLLNIGWLQWQINLFFYLITALVAIIALNVKGIEKTILIVFLFSAMLIFYNFIARKEKNLTPNAISK